ncbi:MAG TPA: hypothetical protein VGY77_12775, partial [Gemmataceae bacterium]|nr:hypothetical protein [Gemmataceae bacterium]
MVDYQRVVDEIRSLLQSADQTLTDLLKELAAEYAQACREANQRLRRCEEFLQKGLRSEAIQLAQAEPNLLDLVAILDFPERGHWDELLLSYGLPASPQLPMKTAEALNEAYSQVVPVEHLLRKHRYLALCRASLPERLGVMRQIAALDTSNPVWAEDIRELEKARIRQMEIEVDNALHHDDARSLETIFGEIRTTQWVANPPLQLIQKVEELARQKKQQRFREVLHGLERELREAVRSSDVDRVRRLRDRWNDETVRGDLPLKDPLWERVAPAFDWLNKQERRSAQEHKQKTALAKLEMALNDSASRGALEQLYRTVIARDGRITEVLEQRYRETLAVAVRAARQRKKMIVAVVASVSVILGAGIIYLLKQSIQANKVAEAVKTVKQLRDAGEILEAAKYLENLENENPRIWNAPDMIPLRTQISTLASKERQRALEFKEALQEAQEAAFENQEKLTNVQNKARTQEEKNAVKDLIQRRGEQAKQLNARREKEFQERFNHLKAQVQVLEKMHAESPGSPEVARLLTKLQPELANLERDSKDVSEELRGLTRSLAVRLEPIRQAPGQMEHEKQLVERFSTALVGGNDIEDYAKMVQEYVKVFPLTPRGKSFQKSLTEKEAWQGVIEWNGMMKSNQNNLLGVSPATAKSRLEQIRDFQKDHPQFVDSQIVGNYRLCLEAIAQQDENDGKSAARELRQLFSSNLIKDLWILQEGQDTYYYLPQNPKTKIDEVRKEGGELVPIKHLSGQQGKIVTKNIPVPRITKTYRAPQSVIGDLVEKMPANFAAMTWEEGTLTLVQRIQENTDMDPILQVS